MTRLLLLPLAAPLTAALLLVASCSSDSTLSGGGMHGTPDAGGDAQDGSSNGGDGGGPIDTGSPLDSNMNLGQPCDPSMASTCGPGLLCCPVSGNLRDGDVFNACMNPQNAPDACP